MTAVAPAGQADQGTALAIEARNVTVRFGGLVALSDVSIAVPPATVVGLVGPNGAGKTTLFGVLSGLLEPQEGEVFLGGRDVTKSSAAKRARMGLSRTFQQLELFMGLTVRDHVVLAYRVRHSRQRIWSDLFTFGSLRPAPKAEDERVDQLIELLGLESVAGALASSLPLGTSRRVEVARALASEPSVVLLDEPSSGLDAHETEQLSTALRTIVEREHVAMLLVEHDVGMVLGMSSAVTVLDFGICIAQGSPDQIRADPAVRAAYLGDDDTIETTRTGSSVPHGEEAAGE